MSAPIFHMVPEVGNPVAPYSHAVEADGWLFIRGQIPNDPKDDNAPLPVGIEAQTVRTMEGLAREAGRPRIAHIMADIQSYHIAPTEAADVVNKAGVKLLVFYHLIPPPDNVILRSMFARGVDSARRGEWDLAEDGALYPLPVGAKDVRVGRVPH
mgnify:CR=1 FL=1